MALKKIKLFVLFWTRIVFVKNNFKVPFVKKIIMNFCGGYLADQYILYDFKHNNKKEYLSEFDWYKSRYINEPFDFAFNNKVICQEILKHYIKMPVNYFIKNKNNLYDCKDGIKQNEDVYNCIVKHERVVIKPFALGKGNGVHVITYINNKLYFDNEHISKKEMYDFLDRHDGLIISEYMKQHEYANRLFSETVNTIRVVTFRDTNTHEFKIYYAVQRIGTSETIPVDNGSKGGLVAKIDLDTGIMSEARCLHNLNVYMNHPDSGEKIEGTRIPQWDCLKESLLDLTKRLPYMDFIAWDLLILDSGDICVIEANTSSGVNILQLWGGQRNEELGKFYEHYNVI